MTLDELKTAWQLYDVKLQSTQALSQQIITSMIKERSQSRLSKIKSRYLVEILYLLAWFCVGIAVLVGNPFDYTQWIEYMPIAVYCGCMGLLINAMIQFHSNLQKVEIKHDTLETSLKKIISVVSSFEKPKSYNKWALKVLLFSASVLFPLSFLPKKIARIGLTGGITETLMVIALAVTLVFIAYKFGAFKQRSEQKFKEDLEELKQLKATHTELLNHPDGEL